MRRQLFIFVTLCTVLACSGFPSPSAGDFIAIAMNSEIFAPLVEHAPCKISVYGPPSLSRRNEGRRR